MTVLIKNVQILDGTGKLPFKADLLIKNDKIAAVEEIIQYRANEVIDGRGAYLAPGFIDINSFSDRYFNMIFEPAQSNFIQQGITTIVGGHCGVSLAPLLNGPTGLIQELNSSKKVNLDWQSFQEFLGALSKRLNGVNFASFVGEKTIRFDLLKGETRRLVGNELKIFHLILERSLQEGACGISLSGNYIANASLKEIKLIADMVIKRQLSLSIHLPSYKENLLTSVERVINISKEYGVRIIINHFAPINGFEKQYQKSITLLENNSEKADIYFAINAKDYSILPAVMLLPKAMRDSKSITDIVNFLKFSEESITKHDNLKLRGDSILILSAPQHQYLEQKTLKQISKSRNWTLVKTLFYLIYITQGRAVVAFKNLNQSLSYKSIISDRAVFSLVDASFPNCEEKFFLKLLKLAELDQILPLSLAIHKITGLPARILGLRDRGLIKVGYYADLVIFRDAEIRDVIINGKIAIRNGEYQNVLAGKVLKF
jgi:N-acyl-D-aspartate/D-glutamate deacylase